MWQREGQGERSEFGPYCDSTRCSVRGLSTQAGEKREKRGDRVVLLQCSAAQQTSGEREGVALMELGPEDVSLLEVSTFKVQASMDLRPEDVSLLERCPHFRGCYVQASMELGSINVYTCKQGTVAILRSKAPVISSPTLYDGLKKDIFPIIPLGFFSV